MPAILETKALLLRSVDYRDSDRIVTLLTPEQGTFGAIARGARKSRKRFGGALQPFQELNVSYTASKSGGLNTLREAKIARPFMALMGSLPAIELGGRMMEFLRSVTADAEPEPMAYAVVCEALEALGETRVQSQSSAFELAFFTRIATLLGVAPQLEHCAETGIECPDHAPALFDPRRGSIVSRQAGGGPLLLSAEARNFLRRSCEAGWLDALTLEPADHQKAARALRAHLVARELLSRESPLLL